MSDVPHPIAILLCDDDAGDVRLTQEALAASKLRNELHVARDGDEAVAFLRRAPGYEDAPRPDLILLDLNMPRRSGHELLAEIKRDPDLAAIPVTVLTTSSADADVQRSYQLHANAFVTKPVDLAQFLAIVQEIEQFWVQIVALPSLSSERDAPRPSR